MKLFPFFGSKPAETKGIETQNTVTVRPVDSNFPRYFIPLLEEQINEDLLINLFNSVAQANAIITYISQMFAGLPAKHFKSQANGKHKEVKGSNVIKLLENPNQLTNGGQFKMNACTYYFVTGNIYIDFIKPVGFDFYTQMYLMPSNRIYPILVGSVDEFGRMPINYDWRTAELKKYNWKLDSKFVPLEVSEVLHIKDNSIGSKTKDQLKGSSRLEAAVKNIQTLNFVAQTLNTLLSNNGALGIIKRNAKANEADSGMWSGAVKEAEAKYLNDYGTITGKRTTLFTEADLSYIRTSSPITEFIPIELQDYEFKVLCKVLGGFPEALLMATDTTFTNLGTARKIAYENIVIPFSDQYYESITNKLINDGMLPENEFIGVDYTEVKALQDDEKVNAETDKVIDDLWLNRYNNNLCTKNEMLIAIGLPIQPDGDKYKQDEQPAETNTETGQGTESGQADEG